MKVYRGGTFLTGFRWYASTGEKRPPKAGERYLSGAIPEVYRATGDLSSPYHIMTEYKLRPGEVVKDGVLYALMEVKRVPGRA